MIFRAVKYLNRKYAELQQDRKFRDEASPIAAHTRQLFDRLGARDIERIVVVGNGPSLKRQDLNLLRDEFTICSNAFYHAYDGLSWRPTIVTVEDPLPAIDNAEYFNGDTESVKLVPYDLRHVINESDTSGYLNFRRSYRYHRSSRWPHFSGDARKETFWGGTVSYLALQIAATFRPRKVILIGTDLSYVIPDSARVAGTVITSTEDDPNHFSPDYFGAGKKWHLPETDRMQRAFTYAHKAMVKLGIELQNATDGGNLRTVPRVSFEDTFS